MKEEQSRVTHAAQKVTREERRWGNMPPSCKEGDMATASILHSIVWLSSPSFSPPSLRRPPSQCCKDFVGVAEEGEKSFAPLRLLLLIDIDGAAAAHVAETHLGIDNETSDLCTDGADMDSSQSEQTGEREGYYY